MSCTVKQILQCEHMERSSILFEHSDLWSSSTTYIHKYECWCEWDGDAKKRSRISSVHCKKCRQTLLKLGNKNYTGKSLHMILPELKGEFCCILWLQLVGFI